jgi:hypothetical protein
LSQESQDNIVIVDISGQRQHLSYPSSNLFDLREGKEAKKCEKAQVKPFEYVSKSLPGRDFVAAANAIRGQQISRRRRERLAPLFWYYCLAPENTARKKRWI